MNSGISTERRARGAETGFQAWHFFVLLSMGGATAAVMVSRDTHPVSLLLLSGAVIAAGLAGVAINNAVAGFFSAEPGVPVLGTQAREVLEREKALILRSIKELEFDRDMGKISPADAAAIMARLRARALALMEDLERLPAEEPAAAPADMACPSCGTAHEEDARFCKQCGAKLAGDAKKGGR